MTPKKPTPLPKRVWAGTREVHLLMVPDDDVRLEGARGMSDLQDTPRIYINDTLTGANLLEVVWHELTHVINWLHDLDEEEKPIIEEKIAEIHGVAWTTMLIVNHRLHRWINETILSIRKDQRKGS